MMDRVKIGFLGSTAPSSPHLDSFRPCVPQDVEFTFVQEADAGDSLWDVQGKTEGLIRQANELIERHGWDGLVISGGPKEVLNPGMWERLGVEIKVPVATALRSSALALKALGVARILLMTPVDDKLKELYRDYLAGFGFAAVYPPQTLRKHTDALKLTPQEVAQMTRQTFAAHPGVDAIYFQGALLDPLPILDQLETELRVPIVASSLARMWDILSQLGRSYRIPGYGTLVANWPPLPRLEKV
jgi:hypothetical protein